MITLTRFNHSEIIVNADLIEFIERTPDTVITMLTGRKVLVLEAADEVRRRVVAYRAETGSPIARLAGLNPPEDTNGDAVQ